MKDSGKEIGGNILKLEGYGLFVTVVDGRIYTSQMEHKSGHPKLDPDGGIEWEELTDPPNQQFLNIINAKWGLALTMLDYDKIMKVSEIVKYGKNRETPLEIPAHWLVKNMRELEK
jgi:hypothetical protein